MNPSPFQAPPAQDLFLFVWIGFWSWPVPGGSLSLQSGFRFAAESASFSSHQIEFPACAA
jgi:hypothetical protein